MQKGNKDCGLFVMRYMKEICTDKELDFAAKVKILISFTFLNKLCFASKTYDSQISSSFLVDA